MFWLSFLSSSLSFLSLQFGLTEAVAIIVLTSIARLALFPVSELSRRALEGIKPELLKLRELYKEDRAQLAALTLHLYRTHGINPLGRWGLLNIGAQGVFGIGVFQLLQRAALSSRFLWIANLAKPDLLLTAVVTVLMLVGMALMPGMSTEMPMVFVLLVTVLIAVIVLAAMPASIGIYWATSNAFTIVQTLILRTMLPPRVATPGGTA